MKRNWIIVGAVAAMMASASAGAFAQTTPDPAAPAPPAAPTTAPMPPAVPDAPAASSMSTGTMSSPTMTMSPDAPDFTLLANPLFNYSEIKGAKAKGLSDSQIASIIRISKLTGMSVRDTTDKVLAGQTFSKIAYDNNLKLTDVLSPDLEKQQVAGYMAAYESSGSMALKPESMSAMPMASDTPAPMASTSSGMMAPKDIVATAMSQKRFSTLVKLLKQANLVETLQGPGPFTVFAPTNAAFKKLPKGTLKNLTSDQLSKILTYHVLPAKVDAATAMAMTSPTSPPTVEGSTLQVTTSNGTVMINDAKVVTADIQASNGIIHAIDTVLMPPDLTPAAGATPTPSTSTTTPAAGGTGMANTDTSAPQTPGASTTATPGAAGTAPTTNPTPPAAGGTTPTTTGQ